MKIKQYVSMVLALAFIVTCCSGVKAYTGNAPIRIDSNSDFMNIASSGNGTIENPWIIEGLDINGTGYGYCIYVGNTTDSFVIQDSYLHGAYILNSDDIYYSNTGIAFYNVENGTVKNNTIESNYGYGMAIYYSSSNMVQGNNVTDNTYGIRLMEGSDYNEVSYNYIWNNSYANVAVEDSDNNEIGYNTADNSQYGIYLLSASWNVVTQNLAYYNDYAVYYEASNNNTVVNNSVCLSDEYGMFLDTSSANNTIYHNNFGNNTIQTCDGGTDNSWDGGYPIGGNFWTDYNGTDQYTGPEQNENGTDVLGDTNYTGLGWAGEAPYPRMEPAGTYGIGKRDDPDGIGKRDDPE